MTTAPTREDRRAETINGERLIARSLKQQGVDYLFGIVGFPVYGLASAAQKEGIRYFGFRNEQAASYAAGAVGYLTGRPGACLTVSGPGMVHGIAGLANAWANCWPMILLGGASDSFQDGQGAFQEAPQIEAARPFVKYAARIDSVARAPFYVEKAVRTSLYGRPGAVYLDLPNDILLGEVSEHEVDTPPRCPEPPTSLADPTAIEQALELLRTAERPLVILGKGAAYARAENQIRQLIETTRLPFLPTPMGKGIVADEHPLSVASARSFALQQADVVLLIGARFNWILHFGLAPRFAAEKKVIQVDIAAEEMGHNVPHEVALVGDARAVVSQLNQALEASPWQRPENCPWMESIDQAADKNRRAVEAMMQDDREPMGYYRVLRAINERLPENAIVIAEGANTMDISRTVVGHSEPRLRLDAGSFGTMGVGLAQAIAAAAVHPEKKVVAIEGDSAFGFSGMEVEVACRYQLPITFLVINNNGIAGGVRELDPAKPVPTFAYTPGARYEKVIEAFGGQGFFVDRVADLGPALDRAIASDRPALVNIQIDPKAARKPQEFTWLTR